MKYRLHGKFNKKDKGVLSLFIIIGGIFISYLFGGFYLVWHIPYETTMVGNIDTSQFIPPNFARLKKMAKTFNYHFDKEHTPLDYTLTVYWKDTTYKKIAYYGTAGDAAIWSGMNLAAQSLHYAAAKKSGDPKEIEYALKLVKKTLRGVSLLIAVPSGGIGERYPALLARSVCPKNWERRGNPPIGGYAHEQRDPSDIFEGVGNYSDYWWKGYPSTDQWSGIILGLGQCARVFINETGMETEWIRHRVRDLAIQIIESFRKSNWMILDQTPSGNSRTTGQDFKISVEMGGHWTLSILKMGMVAVPERYTKLYYHYAIERNYINYMETDYRLFNLYNYYSLNINFNVLTNLVSLEEDPSLRMRYEKIVEKIFHPIINKSRNAWFNMAYLFMMHENRLANLDDTEKMIRLDVLDQLMRFDVPRAPNYTKRIPERGGDKNPIPYAYQDPTEKYRQNPILNFLYGWIFDMYSKDILEYPKRVDEYQAADFLWQRTPWELSGERPYIRQDSGLAFLLPYYIGVYLGLFLY
ncbi:MAG: hypothetical protein ACTSUN_07100 [Promethearchaeota archaeon]